LCDTVNTILNLYYRKISPSSSPLRVDNVIPVMSTLAMAAHALSLVRTRTLGSVVQRVHLAVAAAAAVRRIMP
jgi:hypothetical protein